jgi:hypothetical protein
MFYQAIGVIIVFLFTSLAAYAASVDACNVVWDAPSKDFSGSMPLGNGDVGLNVWVEEDGDLLFYISKTDAWSENARLLKLGRVRVKFSPNPFLKGQPFVQQVKLDEGAILIQAGYEPSRVSIRIWVDANRPVVRVEMEKPDPFEITAVLEIWRTAERNLDGDERFSAYGLAQAPHPVVVSPDTVLTGQNNRVVWYHRNERSIWPETLELQGMADWARRAKDPLLYRTFGGLMGGANLLSEGPTKLRSSIPKTKQDLSVYVVTSQAPTPEAWLHQLDQRVREIGSVDLQTTYNEHCAWWNAFWNRSWIRVSGAPDAETVSRGYALQRFISACAGRGAYPIKFNGSIFTVDARENGKHFDADYRSWGGPYWFQNTRLAYWPMPGSGDFDMMRPLFEMFLNVLPFAQARTKVYFNHAGAFFPETMYFWGAYANDNYGWTREGKPVSHVDNTYIRRHWEGQIELIALLLDYYAYTQDRRLAQEHLLPLADAVITFFDRHYGRDASGKVLFKPAQALETWQNVVNPLPDIAGLQFVLDGLLGLPEDLTTETQRAAWKKLRGELPPLPARELGGKRVLAPAQEILGPVANSENPELYAVFPFRLYGVGKPDLDVARATFEQRSVKGNNGWRQDDTQAAFLGLAAEARKYVAERFAAKNPGSRFPAFWGPNFDWIPDQDHGCNGLMTLQAMLLQADGRKILIFPAWPKEWDVEFKLHAPFNTTVEGVCRSGNLERLTVAPPERQQDVSVLACQ